eukprot:479569_1
MTRTKIQSKIETNTSQMEMNTGTMVHIISNGYNNNNKNESAYTSRMTKSQYNQYSALNRNNQSNHYSSNRGHNNRLNNNFDRNKIQYESCQYNENVNYRVNVYNKQTPNFNNLMKEFMQFHTE